MSVRINTNIEALNAQRNLSAIGSTFAKSVEKLSSGLRINRAADDAAGLAISEKLRAQVTGLNQAQRNAQDGVSMVQTAEGALTEVHSMLQRIRELAVESANSTLSSTDAASVSTEITALRAEINRIAGSTTFNGQYLTTGALSVAQNTGAAGSLVVGTALNTGHTASVSAIDVSGAKANASYTITSQAGGKVTLSDGAGNSQQVTLAGTIGATGTETVNFGNLGVKLTVVGNAAKTATELATDLEATGVATKSIGGVPGTDMVNGAVLASTDEGDVHPNNVVSYNPSLGGLDGSNPLYVHANNAGVPQGTITLAVDGVTHAITCSVGGENFTGTLSPLSDGAMTGVQLHGTHGDAIDIVYRQGSGANWMQEAADMNGASFTFVGGANTAAVANMTAAPTAAAGVYTFTAGSDTGFWMGDGSLTLSGPGGTQTVVFPFMTANSTDTLNFFNLGISFDIHAGPNFMEAGAVVTDLLGATNHTIVVNSSGGGPANNVIATGAGAGANFQVGANAGDALSVSFADARTTAAGYGSLDAKITAFETATGTGNGIVAAAQALITATDTAISYVSTTRGNLGAVQNRLEHTTASISVASENLNASMSRIKDLDVASEMVNFTKTQILQQAGTAILAQANQAPQNILTLLR